MADIIELLRGRALDPVVGTVANPLAAVEVVRQRVMRTVATLFNPKLAGWGAAASQPPDYQAYQRFIEGLDRSLCSLRLPAWNITSALHMLGEHRRELKEARAGRRRAPGLAGLAAEARALAALGRLDEMRQRLDEGFQLPPEDRYTAASVALLVAGELRAHGYGDAAREAVGRAITWHEAQAGREQPEQVFELVQAYFEAGRLDDAQRLLAPQDDQRFQELMRPKG